MTRREGYLMLATASAMNALAWVGLTAGALWRGEWWWFSIDAAATAVSVWLHRRFRGAYRKEPA